MKRVAAVRKQLGVRTIFNLLGPLCNPAGAVYQLMGVGLGSWRRTLAEALAKLGTTRSLVVTGEDGLADITLAGKTDVTEVHEGKLREFVWKADDFGIASTTLETLEVDGPESSAAMIRKILSGQSGPARDIVILNAAAGLFAAGAADEPRQCAERAAEAIDSGAAGKLLADLAALSQ